MSGFEALLRLQDHDVKLEQLEYRLGHLPEQKVVDDNVAALAALDAETAPVQAQRRDLAHEQKRFEDETATVEAKAAQVRHKLYETGITSPKELQALQADFDSLKRRQAELEDHSLEMMEAIEPVDEALVALEARRGVLEADGAAARQALGEVTAAVESDLVAARAARAAIVADVPAEQLAIYEKLRPEFAGIAVARLVGSNCGGCHLTLSSMALSALRKLPPEAVATCDECGRILVR